MLDHVCNMIKITLKQTTWLRLDTWGIDKIYKEKETQKQTFNQPDKQTESHPEDLLSLLQHHSDIIDKTLNHNQIDPYTPTRKRKNSKIFPSHLPHHSSHLPPLSSAQLHHPPPPPHPLPQQYYYQHDAIKDGEMVDNGKDASLKAEGCIEVMLLCGSDLLKTSSSCQLNQIEKIVSQYNVIVITRTDHNVDEYIYHSDILSKYKSSIHIVSDWIPNDIRSSRIRTAIRRKESVKYLLPDCVLNYIYKNNLYSTNIFQLQHLQQQQQQQHHHGDQVMHVSLSSAPSLQTDLDTIDLLDQKHYKQGLIQKDIPHPSQLFQLPLFPFSHQQQQQQQQYLNQSQQPLLQPQPLEKPHFGLWNLNKLYDFNCPPLSTSAYFFNPQKITQPSKQFQFEQQLDQQQQQQQQQQLDLELEQHFFPPFPQTKWSSYGYHDYQNDPRQQEFLELQRQQKYQLKRRGASTPRSFNVPLTSSEDNKTFGRSKSLEIDSRKKPGQTSSSSLSGPKKSIIHGHPPLQHPPASQYHQHQPASYVDMERKKKCKRDNSMDSLISKITKTMLGENKQQQQQQQQQQTSHQQHPQQRKKVEQQQQQLLRQFQKQEHQIKTQQQFFYHQLPPQYQPSFLLQQQQRPQQQQQQQQHQYSQPSYHPVEFKARSSSIVPSIPNKNYSAKQNKNKKNYSLDSELERRQQQIQRPHHLQSSEKLKVDQPNVTMATKNVKPVRLTPETCV